MDHCIAFLSGVEYRSVPNPTQGDFCLRFVPDILPDEKDMLPSEWRDMRE